MNMTDREVEAAIRAYQEEHGEWPKPTAFVRELRINYNRGRDAIERVKAQAVEAPRQESNDNPIPEPVWQAFKSAWHSATKEAHAALEVARANYERKLKELALERDELAEAFDVTKAELVTMAEQRDSLALEVAELVRRAENAERSAKVAELRAETILEATKAIGLDVAAHLTSDAKTAPTKDRPDAKIVAA